MNVICGLECFRCFLLILLSLIQSENTYQTPWPCFSFDVINNQTRDPVWPVTIFSMPSICTTVYATWGGTWRRKSLIYQHACHILNVIYSFECLQVQRKMWFLDFWLRRQCGLFCCFFVGWSANWQFWNVILLAPIFKLQSDFPIILFHLDFNPCISEFLNVQCRLIFFLIDSPSDRFNFSNWHVSEIDPDQTLQCKCRLSSFHMFHFFFTN